MGETGNVDGPIARPSDTTASMQRNAFIWEFANSDQAPVAGLLHAKSGVIVVGAVNRDPTGTWVLASDSRGHSARAGHARHAFIVTPDDGIAGRFTGTSLAAPRVAGALAILRQKCPRLSAQELGFILLRSAQDLGDRRVDDVYGWGLMNLENALDNAKKLAAEFRSYDSTVKATS